MSDNGWEFYVDRGGTFTDIVGLAPNGHLCVKKLLSVNDRLYNDAAVQGIREILCAASNDTRIPSSAISSIKLGTTVATNALLERKGEPTVLVTTEGFRDALRIGYQNRPDIFARQIVLPTQLYAHVIEAHERISAQGAVLTPLNEDQLLTDLQAAHDAGFNSCAIVFMHAYSHTDHEKAAAQLARQAGFKHISCSHETSALIKFVTRGETTVADAYLSPILRQYVDKFTNQIGDSTRILFMQSNGGLVDGAHFKGKDSLLSGPAGGIVGAAKTCSQIGLHKLIAFDMGGTSTDVSHYNGAYERSFDNIIGGARISAPMMNIHTVAAGGGSIVQLRSGRLQVGPESAGAAPGPACYRNGGPLTITDCNVLLGRIQPAFFPHLFGDQGDQSLDGDVVRDNFARLCCEVNESCGTSWTKEDLAQSFVDIAVEKMASAIKKVSIERGHDIDDYALCSFGGAGAQHACQISNVLGLERVVIHPLAGVLSALGIGLSELRVLKQQSINEPLGRSHSQKLLTALEDLERAATNELSEQFICDQFVSAPKASLRSPSPRDPASAAPTPRRLAFADSPDLWESSAPSASATPTPPHDPASAAPTPRRLAFADSPDLWESGAPSASATPTPPHDPASAAPTPRRLAFADSPDLSESGAPSASAPSPTARGPASVTPTPHRVAFGNSLDQKANAASRINVRRSLIVRYEGTDFGIEVEMNSVEQISRDFNDAHRRRYGFIAEDKRLIVDSACVETWESVDAPQVAQQQIEFGGDTTANSVPLYANHRWWQAPVHKCQMMQPQSVIKGPALIVDDTNTIFVAPLWCATKTSDGFIILDHERSRAIEDTRNQGMASQSSTGQRPDPARLELFNNLFTAIAEEMGVQLQSTSHSVNIKERLDFSCAIFDGAGRLIANAPHIPVHLGSMGESVRSLIADHGTELSPGDSYVLNNPFNGGTHLPDITVISPVFEPSGSESKEILFFVVSRGHHADIGGITPGSMPPNSRLLEEEGAVIDHLLLVRSGDFHETRIREILTRQKYPARNVAQNIADLKAQVAANARGESGLRALVQQYGIPTVQKYMGFVRENAAQAVRSTISRLRDGSFTCEMDDGERIVVEIKLDLARQTALIDFTGTSAQVKSNLNAPISISRAAVLYVFRTLIDDPIPLNDGCLEPIQIVIPQGSMINPVFPAAVVAGNVETSQIVTDCLYGALGVLAGSQGTMNNFTFGNDQYQYYETICGGAGAGADFDGTSAVQTHMTNSRLTDPEVLELRFPVLLESFQIRKGSGGAGKHKGGDGAIRRIRFLEDMTASILSQRRRVAPFGLFGGRPGKVGENYVIRSSGEIERLAGTATVELKPADVFVIETPGGGGYG